MVLPFHFRLSKAPGSGRRAGVAVYVKNRGQLGTLLSSQRFKQSITDMGDSNSKLLHLRPVDFFTSRSGTTGRHLLPPVDSERAPASVTARRNG